MTSPTWRAAESEPDFQRPDAAAWMRIARRALPTLLLISVGFALLLVLRLVERPTAGSRRAVTGWVTTLVCRGAMVLMGMRLTRSGTPLDGPGAYVANHTSWLDIFVLNSARPLVFVSKSEVAGWAGIGWLARGTGTVFISRDRRAAPEQTALLTDRLRGGTRLLFFPEGTSTDGRQVLAFKTTLFAPFFEKDLRDTLRVQPVSVVYHAPPGEDDRFYGWWGNMGFGPHLLATLAAKQPGAVDVLYHPPLNVADFPDRKTLAAVAEDAVRAGHTKLQTSCVSALAMARPSR